MLPTAAHLDRRKRVLYRAMYDFTRAQCTECARSGCACKDTICAHVDEQNRRAGRVYPRGAHALRFIGCAGCVVPPHHRETCTLYLCEAARTAPGFDRARYERLRALIDRVEWRLMELEESKIDLDTPRPR